MKVSDLTPKQRERMIRIMDRAIATIENTKSVFLENSVENYADHEFTEEFKTEMKHLLRYQAYPLEGNQRQEDEDMIDNL
jgi:hypothetical protein